jgi:3-methyladenine DNA glycosylase AlkD
MDVNTVVSDLAEELREAGSPERSVKERAYLKSELEHYGTGVPAIRRATTQMVRSHRPFDHATLVELVGALWSRPVHELRMAAVEVLDLEAGQLTADDVPLLERLLRESRTWALVDGLSASVVGQVVERYPDELTTVLDRWSTDDDVWIRRSALLANLVALRKGGGDFERFGRIADRLLDDPEFWIRKAIGWVLRDTSRKRPELVAAWLLPRAGRTSALTVREAVKYLDPDDRRAILDARVTD